VSFNLLIYKHNIKDARFYHRILTHPCIYSINLTAKISIPNSAGLASFWAFDKRLKTLFQRNSIILNNISYLDCNLILFKRQKILHKESFLQIDHIFKSLIDKIEARELG